MKTIRIMMMLVSILPFSLSGQIKSDVVHTSAGDLEMFFVGHGTLMFKFNGKVIHIDPTIREADYSSMPSADLVLVTHQHGDHLDPTALKHIVKEGTRVVMTQKCLDEMEGFEAEVMKNGDHKKILGIGIEALPAYNIQHTRPGGQPYHPKGEGNAYLLVFGDTRVLIGGDTENIPELKALKNIQIAFLPMNLPYTMDPEMVADLARAIRPDILYPYHYGNTDPGELVDLLKYEKDIEVRVRELR
jgi:L-ascorbate metabolism protein UlaG (beta-lactamase superfamily)